MFISPDTEPNSAIVTLGYTSMGWQGSPKVGQVRHVLSALHVVSERILAQKPSIDSDEHARYGLHVSYGTPAGLCFTYWYTPPAEPPLSPGE
jgi:hypothetical protein